jgi:hypothetical protein
VAVASEEASAESALLPSVGAVFSEIMAELGPEAPNSEQFALFDLSDELDNDISSTDEERVVWL